MNHMADLANKNNKVYQRYQALYALSSLDSSTYLNLPCMVQHNESKKNSSREADQAFQYI